MIGPACSARKKKKKEGKQRIRTTEDIKTERKRTSNQTDARSLPTHRTTQIQNKLTQTSMPQVGFEPTTPVFARAKTIHAVDLAATVIGIVLCYSSSNQVIRLILKTSTLLRILLEKNSVDLVRTQSIPTERPPLVGEVSINFAW
jgi:hypothetical protein